MKYLLDFDRTVFDMEGLYAAIAEQNPNADVGTVSSLEGIDLERLLFSDAVEFFAAHDAADIEIVSSGFGLTGQWEVAYQAKKIELSGVATYVHDIHVVADSKISTIKRIARESEDMVYVDDHPENVANAIQHVPGMKVAHIVRQGEAALVPGSVLIDSLSNLDASIGL